jgi:fumarylacetoacetase
MAAGRLSWIESANDPISDFPLQNLPYGIFQHEGKSHLCTAIGDRILDLNGCAIGGLLADLSQPVAEACTATSLNPLLALGPTAWTALRKRLTDLLAADARDSSLQRRLLPYLFQQTDVQLELPVSIGDYTDFYASIHHATRVGSLFRPQNPLLPNYKHIPIGYHGRSSSIILSGQPIRRPCGQIKLGNHDPIFGPTRSLDFELEMGLIIGPGNKLGQPIPIAKAEQHIFGLCLVNDWSARDIQSWEYQPLGPFLGKSFATTISPWIVPLEALAPFRSPTAIRAADDPQPLAYLQPVPGSLTEMDLTLQVYLQSERMRQLQRDPVLLTTSNLKNLYWSLAQMVTHQTSNGCNLRPGDMLATGTISGPQRGSEGCLLEMTAYQAPIQLPGGEQRRYLEDGDTVILRAYAQKKGFPRIGFGECSGTISPALINS